MPFFLLSLFFTNFSFANELDDSVWQGTLGKQKITVCFQFNLRDDKLEGKYYYHRYLTAIPLSFENDGSLTWLEDNGVWKLAPPKNNTLTGFWSKPGDKKTLPILLKEIITKQDDSGCESDAFNLAI